MIKRFDVKPKSTDDNINWDELVRLDDEGWRLVTVVGKAEDTLRYGLPMWAICQKSDNMLELPPITKERLEEFKTQLCDNMLEAQKVKPKAKAKKKNDPFGFEKIKNGKK